MKTSNSRLISLIAIFVAAVLLPIRFGSGNLPSNFNRTYLAGGFSIPMSKGSHNIKPVSGVIRYGQSLWHILKRQRIVDRDIQPAIDALNRELDVRLIRPGQKYELEKDSLRNLISYRFHPDLLTTYVVERDSSGAFICRIDKKELNKRIQTLTGTITTTLYESVIDQGESPELIVAFTDVFQWDIDFFTDPQPGDHYKIIYEAYFLEDRFFQYGNILAGQYSINGEILTAFYYKDHNGKGGYYDWEGQSLQKTFLKSPLNYRRISSYFTFGRRHPILKKVRPHLGVDYAANSGTPVVASADGIVVETGYQYRGLGRFIKIKHPNSKFKTAYGHLRGFAKGIRKGSKVVQNQVIGYVGSTGLATGPHLHYTFYEDGRPVNPLQILNNSTDPVEPQELALFKARAITHLEMLSELPDGALYACRLKY